MSKSSSYSMTVSMDIVVVIGAAMSFALSEFSTAATTLMFSIVSDDCSMAGATVSIFVRFLFFGVADSERARFPAMAISLDVDVGNFVEFVAAIEIVVDWCIVESAGILLRVGASVS